MSEINKDEVHAQITTDPLAAEFNVCIFSAALLSYRKDACLRPCPDISNQHSNQDDQGNQDMERFEHLTATLSTIPPLSDINKHTLSDESWKLIQWMCCNKTITVKSCDKNMLNSVSKATGHSSFSLQPDEIFEVVYNTTASQQFDELKEKHGFKYAYHGSRLDNFYSIVNNGLQVHMMKNGLFGEGIYFSDDLSITMPYTKSGTVWQHSQLGDQLSCVALCELIDNDEVKCKVDNDPGKKRSTARNSESGDVPERYYVVTRSELVRVKYILVFSNNKPAKKRARTSWICQRYPVACLLCLYFLFLVFMGVYKSRSFQLFYRKYFLAASNDDDDDDD